MNEEINKSNDMIKGLSSLFIGSALLGMSAIFVRYSDSSPSLVAVSYTHLRAHETS